MVSIISPFMICNFPKCTIVSVQRRKFTAGNSNQHFIIILIFAARYIRLYVGKRQPSNNTSDLWGVVNSIEKYRRMPYLLLTLIVVSQQNVIFANVTALIKNGFLSVGTHSNPIRLFNSLLQKNCITMLCCCS